MKNKSSLIILVILILGLLFYAGKYAYQKSQIKKFDFLLNANAKTFVRPHSPTLGNPNAPVYLVEFLDPECESCRVFYPYIKEILSDYADKVQLVIRYAPFHKNSMHAVKALEAVRLQGKYWESLNILFATQPKWANHHSPKPELIWDFLPSVGVDIKKAKEDMDNPKIIEAIMQDIKDGKTLGVNRTPSFFVNGKPLLKFGVQPLRELIDDELQKISE